MVTVVVENISAFGETKELSLSESLSIVKYGFDKPNVLIKKIKELWESIKNCFIQIFGVKEPVNKDVLVPQNDIQRWNNDPAWAAYKRG